MPELPEITALAAFLVDHAAGQTVTAVHVASLNVLTTFDPPAAALVGRTVTGAGRHGKFLDVRTAPGSGSPPDAPPELHLLLHLARAGWLRWSDAISPRPPKMGGPIALRVVLSGGAGRGQAGPGRSGPGPVGPGEGAGRSDRSAQERHHRPAGHRRDRQRLLGRDPAHREAVAVRPRRPARPGRTRPAARGHGHGAHR